MDWIKETLFDSGWVTISAVAVAGVAALLLFRRVRHIGVTLLLLAAVLAGLRWFFPTDARRMETRTNRLMHAIETRDWTTASSLLSDQTTLGTEGQDWVTGKDPIVDMAKLACDQDGLHTARITGIESESAPSDIKELVNLVTTQQETADSPMPSLLKLEYVKSDSDWMLVRITVLSVNDQPAESLWPSKPNNLTPR